MRQWHPVFAKLLRPAVERAYDVQTTVPVGDAPREADFVLLRRKAATSPPFHGLWRFLTLWNILEFKGPSVTPRRGHLELLVELGLGIDRRLHEERTSRRQPRLPPDAVSFWYLANHLGRRFLRHAEELAGPLQPLGPGLWRSQVLGRLLFLVSGVDLPVEEDSLPLHLIGKEPPETERAVAQLVAEQPHLQQLYGGWVASLHPAAWREVEAMVRAKGKKWLYDLRPAIEMLGLDHVIEQVGMKRVIEQIGAKEVIRQIGAKEVIRQIGLDNISALLTPDERRRLKQSLGG